MAYVKQTWVDQEGQVRYSETADGDYKIFTPNYEEVTEMGTPVNAVNMNHIEGGIEYCDTNMVKRKSTSQATGNSTQPVYVKDDGVVEVCNIDVSNSRFDGQWVSSMKTLSTATAVGTYTIDLSSYLPNDNYNYEVEIYTKASKKGTGFGTIYIQDRIVNIFSGTGSTFIANVNTVYVTITSSRTFNMSISNESIANTDIRACKYRRIGTNI